MRAIHLEHPEPDNILRDFTVGAPVCGARGFRLPRTESRKRVTCKRCLRWLAKRKGWA